jgi:AcrR family transcriptional regulator
MMRESTRAVANGDMSDLDAKARINPVKLQQILISARALFFSQGFSATSMEAVAKEARVGKATLYERFPNKIELLRAIIEIELEMRADALLLAPAPSGPLRATLARIGHAIMELLLSPANVAIYRIISAEAPRHPEIGRLFYENGPSHVRTHGRRPAPACSSAPGGDPIHRYNPCRHANTLDVRHR